MPRSDCASAHVRACLEGIFSLDVAHIYIYSTIYILRSHVLEYGQQVNVHLLHIPFAQKEIHVNLFGSLLKKYPLYPRHYV